MKQTKGVLRTAIFAIKRNLSSTALRVANVSIPSDISKEFYNITLEHLQKSASSIDSLKPMSLEEGESGTKLLKELIRNDPKTHESVEKIKEDKDLTGIVINGIGVSNITKEEIPTEVSHLQNPQLIKKLRPNEIATYAYGSILGANPTDYMVAGSFVTPIFSTEQDRYRNSSFRSGKELLWHNDGWSDVPAHYVILLGLVGKKEIRTEIVDARDIITHFQKSGKQDYLDVLGKISEQIDFAENYSDVRILDSDGKISYAQYGNFMAKSESDSATFRKAISFLQDSLYSKEIPTFGLSIGSGQALIQRNDRGLHRKTTEGPSELVKDSIGERLLLRAHSMTIDSKS